MLDRKIIDDVLASISLPDLMRENGHDLKPGNNGFMTRCVSPEHEDKTPSMSIFNEKKMHCFGCGVKGSAIDYLQMTQGVSFKEAVVQLAQRGGIKLPDSWGKENSVAEAEGPVWSKFADTLMKAALRTPEAQASLEGKEEKGQKYSSMGIGFLPAMIAHEKWAKFLERQPSEFLEVAGITKQEDGTYTAAGRYIWPLRDSGAIVGFAQFGMDGKGAEIKYAPKTRGHGCAVAEGQAWAGKRHACLNVTNDPELAVRIHAGASAWGPAAYLPLQKEAGIGTGIFRTLARFKKIRFIARESRDLATFAIRSLYSITDNDLIKLMHLPANTPLDPQAFLEKPVFMSAFLRKWIEKAPAGVKNGNMFLEALRDNRHSIFYRSLLSRELDGAIKARVASEQQYSDLERG